MFVRFRRWPCECLCLYLGFLVGVLLDCGGALCGGVTTSIAGILGDDICCKLKLLLERNGL